MGLVCASKQCFTANIGEKGDTMMLRNKMLGVKLNEAEEAALVTWASYEGLDKSVLMRRLFRLALRKAPRSIFPVNIIDTLNLSHEIES